MIRARARRREPLNLLEISVVDQYWFESIEVNRPAFVDARRDGHRYLRPRELLATLAANLKPFLAIDPVGPLRVLDQPPPLAACRAASDSRSAGSAQRAPSGGREARCHWGVLEILCQSFNLEERGLTQNF